MYRCWFDLQFLIKLVKIDKVLIFNSPWRYCSALFILDVLDKPESNEDLAVPSVTFLDPLQQPKVHDSNHKTTEGFWNGKTEPITIKEEPMDCSDMLAENHPFSFDGNKGKEQ